MDYCNYCGEDFRNGDPVRSHRRGVILHERCYVERSEAPTFQAQYYADQTSTYQAEGF